MIRDLEEIALHVRDPLARLYLAEAIRCYYAAAYRASIVLSVAAAFDYLRRQFEELAGSGGLSPHAKAELAKVREKFSAQDSYERNLLDLAWNVGSITSEERKRVSSLLDIRNLAAHPSGYQGSPEEARSVLTAMVDVFLAKPVRLGISELETLMERIGRREFFPSVMASAIDETVIHEMSRVHPTAFQPLVNKLFDRVKKEAPKKRLLADQTECKNVQLFLAGLWRSMPEARDLLGPRFARLVEDGVPFLRWAGVLAETPEVLAALPGVTRKRLLSVIRSHLLGNRTQSDSDASRILMAILIADVLQEGERDLLLNSTPSVVEALPLDRCLELPWPEWRDKALDVAIGRVSSYQFAYARVGINQIQSLSVEYEKHFAREQRVRYLLNLALAAKNNTSPANLMAESEGLGERIAFIDSIKAVLEEDPEGLFEEETSWLHFMRLLLASRRPDIVAALMRAAVKHQAADRLGEDALEEVAERCQGVARDAKRLLNQLREKAS